MDAGKVDNTATASGKPPTGTNVTATDSVTVVVPTLASIAIDKTASAISDANSNGVQDAGDTITYSFEVTNTGNVALTLIAVDDPKLGGAIPCASTSLAPGASMTCPPKTYPLTLADLNASTVVNTATVTGKPPTGPNVTDDDSTTTALQGHAAIDLDKIAGAITDTNGSGKPDAGDKITYTFKVTNIGTVTLSSVNVTDVKVGAISCPATTLAPGASTTCTATAYMLTQADVDAGKVENTATATGHATHRPAGERRRLDEHAGPGVPLDQAREDR